MDESVSLLVSMVQEQGRADDKNLVRKIKELLMRRCEVKVHYTPRLANMVADFIANVSKEGSLGLFVYDELLGMVTTTYC
ncbi:hypothetical protein Godav_005946 [Gossypium davidsonii]|uniref:RNase H type-1 domain-containing protein n=1 Tax=Gossypium davidsonii TaxID=34287 RepID=A0A7J8S2V1_GOSDV|nr:hypothetical protein [Gossypium davidsonii]